MHASGVERLIADYFQKSTPGVTDRPERDLDRTTFRPPTRNDMDRSENQIPGLGLRPDELWFSKRNTPPKPILFQTFRPLVEGSESLGMNRFLA